MTREEFEAEYAKGRRDFSHANMSYANMSGADMRGADMRGADMRNANMRYADMSGADMSGANMSGANMSGADMSGADMSGADMSGAVGNMRELWSAHFETWPITWTREALQIGYQKHTISDWWSFTDDQIARMDSRALDWWRKWKELLRQVVEASLQQ